MCRVASNHRRERNSGQLTINGILRGPVQDRIDMQRRSDPITDIAVFLGDIMREEREERHQTSPDRPVSFNAQQE